MCIRGSLYAGVFLLCLAYTVMIVGFLSGGIDPGGPGGGDFTTLAGVMKLFDSPGGATLGWTHYLAFDLFTGMWIARDADQKGFSRICLLYTSPSPRDRTRSRMPSSA